MNLNKRIVELRGECWHEFLLIRENVAVSFERYKCSKCKKIVSNPYLHANPDYENDMNLCMKLFEELPSIATIERSGQEWRVIFLKFDLNSEMYFGKTPNEAICKAWIAWKEKP